MQANKKYSTKICWVNKNEFPVGTKWGDMHKAGEAAYPGSTTRICSPGEILNGCEEVPLAFNGKFLCEEIDQVLVEVSSEEIDAYETAWEESNPVTPDTDYGKRFTDLSDARYQHFRGKFYFEHKEYRRCRVRFSFEVLSCYDEEEVA